MDERPQRSLRPRKLHPYLPPDTEDPDQLRYQRFNYNKEPISPAMELNTQAKTLVKLFNSVNKAYRQSQTIQEHHTHGKHESSHGSRSIPKTKNHLETHPKTQPSRKTQKEDFFKRDKQIPSLKNQSHTQSISKFQIKNEPSLQRSQFNDSYYNQSVNLLAKMGQQNPSSLLAHLSEVGLMFDPKMLLLQPPENPNQAAERALAQRKIFMNQNQLYSSKPKSQVQKAKDKDNKLFGRSAYHVAIAYHIHLKKIKDSGQLINNNSQSLDPTYQARKLKGDQIRPSSMEPQK